MTFPSIPRRGRVFTKTVTGIRARGKCSFPQFICTMLLPLTCCDLLRLETLKFYILKTRMKCHGSSALIYRRAFNKFIVISVRARLPFFIVKLAIFETCGYFYTRALLRHLRRLRCINECSVPPLHICFVSRLINTRHRRGISVFRGRRVGLWGGFRLSVQSKHYAQNHLASRRRKSRRGIFINNPERAEKYLPARETSL